LKYAGLTPSEIWISEAQERMVLSVPPENVQKIQAICDRHSAELCDLGEFGTPGTELILKYNGETVGQIEMQFLHEGYPGTTRTAVWSPKKVRASGVNNIDIQTMLPQLLAHPNIASKQSIVQQYDHEVQGRSVIRPFCGPSGNAPSDAAVITPVRGSKRGLAIGSGLATGLAADPYLIATAAIDECVRNIVCVGGDPSTIAILDNYCWPSAKDEESLGRLVRCSHGCYDAAKAYKTPFISGKDSLNNQFTTESGETIYIPPTMLISGFGMIDDIENCVTMDAKSAGNVLVLVGETTSSMGGSHLLMIDPEANCDNSLPTVSLTKGPRNANAVFKAIRSGLVASAHDCSEGGILLAAAEMAFGGGLGLALTLDDESLCFSETPSRYFLEVKPENVEKILQHFDTVPCTVVGTFNESNTLTLGGASWNIEDLLRGWMQGMVI
jgi:phosphoribosylformylglycinamidine synthase